MVESPYSRAGVISAQRLLLVLFATLIDNVLVRHIFLVLTCLVRCVRVSVYACEPQSTRLVLCAYVCVCTCE